MRYNRETGELELDARELVAITRRGVSPSAVRDEDEPECPTEGKRTLSYTFSSLGHSFLLNARVDSAREGEIHLDVPVDSSPRRPRKEVRQQARGEAFVAAYILAETTGLGRVDIYYTYRSRTTGEENEITESAKKHALDAFFAKCMNAIAVYAQPEIDRVTKRLPSMRGVKFPYDSVRAGQEDIIHSVYRNVTRGGTLFTAAPTGTGKTVSMLYPAVRAMGEGRCAKIFYLTPKTTTAKAAEDCIRRLGEGGASIRSVTLPSKERACERGVRCREPLGECPNTQKNNIADALIALYNKNLATVGIGEVREVARLHSVCPYELALTYAEICDVVICDINYLFNPSVYIRRFFTEGGSFAFLIDEAHNLPDRAREMYSAASTEEDMLALCSDECFGEHSRVKNVTRGATEQLRALLYPYVKDEIYGDKDGHERGATHLSELPSEMYGIMDSLLAALEDELFAARGDKDADAPKRLASLKEYYYKIRRIREVMEAFDSGYELFIFFDGGKISFKLFCIDPSSQIAKRLGLGSSATFFSGTLTPMYYYRAVLGADNSATMMEVDSPFDESQLSVSIMHKISTRHQERGRTLGAVCRAIAATVSARRGNYMIFAPSFEYAEMLHRAFSEKYPKIKTLLQHKGMSAAERSAFLAEFEKEDSSYLIGFCVMGGIYSEGVDLAGESLIGAVVVGIGIPAISYEREAIAAYYNDKYDEGVQFAYVYPGVNRVLQAAGRVIRRDDDRGVIVLIDDRFDDPIYKTVIPKLWSGMKFIDDAKQLRAELDKFWASK